MFITTNTILYCENWQASIAFYRDVLALPVLFANDWFVEFSLTSQARLSVANSARTSIASSQKGQGITLTFQVQPLIDWHERLRVAGYSPTEIHQRWGARSFFVCDPQGNRLEFWEKLAE